METPKEILVKMFENGEAFYNEKDIIKAMEDYAKIRAIEFAKLIIDNNVKLKLALPHIYENGLRA